MSLSRQQAEKAKAVFSLYVTRDDGNVGGRELGEIVRALGLNPTESEIRGLLGQKPSDARISFQQFLTIYETLAKQDKPASQQEMNEILDSLKMYDDKNTGFIKKADLAHILTSLGERLSDDELEVLLQGFVDNRGNVDYVKFVNAVLT